MLIRIVKLTFKIGDIPEFEQIFEETRYLIMDFEGCTSLELLQDVSNPSIFFTYSQWDSEDHLNNYRNSDFFNGLWSKTKLLFAAKPEAWSVHKKQ